MTLDPRAKRFLDLLAASGAASAAGLAVEARRQSLIDIMRWAGRGPDVAAVRDGSIPGPAGPIAVRVYDGAAAGGAAGLIYLHGGGLVAGSIDTHEPIARALAAYGRCRVLAVDYRLAPEHRFPAALEDALAVVGYMRTQAENFGIDARRLGLCGDSAGGNLAAAVCASAAGRRQPSLVLQLLICPILDYAGMSASRRSLVQGYFVDEATLMDDLAAYLPPGMDPDDPRISPLRAPTVDGLPPTLIHTAEYDPLRDEARAYADRLTAAGIQVSYTCHPGMIHLFYGLGSLIPHARIALEQIGLQIREALRTGSQESPRL